MVDKSFRVRVRSSGNPPNPYKWEIYRGHNRIERSMQGYPSEQAAAEAGTQAMARILDRQSAAKRRT
jgi:hypothetical protein